MKAYINIIPELLETEQYTKITLRTYRGSQRIAETQLGKHQILEFKDWKLPIQDSMLKGEPTHYEYELTYPEGVRTFKYPFPTIIKTLPGFDVVQHPCLRINKHILYDNNPDDKRLVLALLDTLFAQTKELSSIPRGTKNLIYYTIGCDTDYIKLLEMSISSIVDNTPTINFDFLILTTPDFLPILQASPILKKISNLIFHVVDTTFPDDGVFVGMNKTKIFSYPGLSNYKTVLFLDCDVVCLKDVSKIFSSARWNPELLYSVCNPEIHMGAHQGIYHGLDYNDPDMMARVVAYDQRPFNAGQFLFINSEKMEKHFSNINWLMSVWPGYFFFEQCFMNRYVCNNLLLNYKQLGALFSLVTSDITKVDTKVHKDSDVCIHFIAPPTEPLVKLSFIKDYANAHQLRL